MNKLLVMIKNYLKLIFRNKVMIIVVPIATVIVVAALANAFHTLLDTNESVSDFKVGYEMAEDSQYAYAEDFLMASFNEQGISTIEYENGDPEMLIKNGDVDVYVDFEGDSYHIYGDNNKELQVRIVQYVLFNMDKGMENATTNLCPVSVNSSSLETIKTSGAENYYGIIEIVYFLSLCTVFLSFIFQTERSSHIGSRFGVSNAGAAFRYFSKYFACLITAIIVQIVAVGVIVTAFFDVSMGNPAVFFGILILSAAAFTAFGLIFMLIFNNMAVSLGLFFVVMWFAGELGGTYETYMYEDFPESVKRCSPLYFVNRTLVETSVNGSSNYLIPCIMVLAGIIAVCVPLGILITATKKEV